MFLWVHCCQMKLQNLLVHMLFHLLTVLAAPRLEKKNLKTNRTNNSTLILFVNKRKQLI